MKRRARRVAAKIAYAFAWLNVQREKRPIKWAIIEMLVVWGLIASTAYWAAH